MLRRAHLLAQPAHERRGGVELGADARTCLRAMQPGAELVAAGDGQAPAPEQLCARVIRRVPARGAHQVGLVQLEAGVARARDGARQRSGAAARVYGRAQALDLVGRGVVQAGGDEQAVERELDVEAAGALVADRKPDVLLQRRARAKARVVPGPEHARLAEVHEIIAEQRCGAAQVVLVARAVGLEPVAVVVVLELAEELDRLGGKAAEGCHRVGSCRGRARHAPSSAHGGSTVSPTTPTAKTAIARIESGPSLAMHLNGRPTTPVA